MQYTQQANKRKRELKHDLCLVGEYIRSSRSLKAAQGLKRLQRVLEAWEAQCK